MKLVIDIFYIGMVVGFTLFSWRLLRELRDERDQ